MIRNARPQAGTAPRRPGPPVMFVQATCVRSLDSLPALPQFVHRPFSGKFLMPLSKLLKPEPGGAGATRASSRARNAARLYG